MRKNVLTRDLAVLKMKYEQREKQGNLMVTGSFDHDSRIWDTRTGTCVHRLQGHTGEVSSTQFNYGGDLCVSGSIDR